MPASVAAERLQKVLSQLGLGSRREAEGWIRAGRLTVNGRPAVLGMRVGAEDQLKLDGRTIRRGQAAAAESSVYICHRSQGEPLLPARTPAGDTGASANASASANANANVSLAERLPRRAGRRFISISPMPTVDGGLELLTSDGATAERLQRAVHGLEMEFSLRVRGELSPIQQQGIREGALDSGAALRVLKLEANGGEGSNRWYRLIALGASGNEIRQLVERQAVTLGRMLRTRLGKLELPRTLARSHFRELTEEELTALKP
jgi:23S rRNA pseudouridine2605 synthase